MNSHSVFVPLLNSDSEELSELELESSSLDVDSSSESTSVEVSSSSDSSSSFRFFCRLQCLAGNLGGTVFFRFPESESELSEPDSESSSSS